MEIKIDAKNELITILHYLGEYKSYFPLVATNTNKYTELIDKWFYAHRNHPAVIFSDKLANNGFCYDAPYAFINHLCGETKLQVKYGYSEYVLKRIGGNDFANEFVQLINAFIDDTNYYDFWKLAVVELAEINREIQEKFLGADNENKLYTYYGQNPGKYNVVFSVLSLGGFCVTVSDEKETEVINVIGLEGSIDKIPRSDVYFNTMIWHEFGHSIINKLTDIYINEVNKYKECFIPIEEQMKQHAYPEWFCCVNEHIIRAITNRMVLKYYGNKSYESINNWDLKNGFIYVEKILPLLSEYETNRSKYSTIDTFYPLLLKAFED